MKALAFALALAASTPAQADIFSSAFLRASFEPNDRVLAVVAAMQEFVPLQEMARQGRIASPYDCLPEHRVICAEAIANPGGETVIQEWGEWTDSLSKEDLPAFVFDMMADAAKDGFNLFTNDELNGAEGYE